jgi:chromosome segregation ATPase
MTMRVKIFSVVIWVLALSMVALAQAPERRAANSNPQAQEQSLNTTSIATVANELGLLRKSLQTLNERLRVISDTLLAPDAKENDPKEQQARIANNIDLLSRAEQRAEALRKQLFELTERETTLRNRLVQIDDDLRPENIERAVSLVGTTRTVEMRDTRRRLLENDRKGYEALFNQTSQARQQLEDVVRQADAQVARLRSRLSPLIEKEIDKINPN